MGITADAVIVGGGVMGCSILHALACHGLKKAMLLESEILSFGSTGKSQGILRMHYSNELTSRMAWESLQIFKSFGEVVGGDSGYVKTGYLLIAGQGDRNAMAENVAMQKKIGISTEMISPGRVRDIAPAFSVEDEEVCTYEPESGYADPYLVTHAYATAAKKLGAEIHVSTPVERVEVNKGRVSGVTTSSGTISTPTAVVAAGPWSSSFLESVGVMLPLEVIRHNVVTFRRPTHYIVDHPVLGDVVNGFSVRPEVGDVTLVAFGEEERVTTESHVQSIDMPVVEDVSARLANRMPGMGEAIFRGGWSGLFTTTPDWHPILDSIPGIEGLYVAVGFSGHGFKLAPMVGVAMAEIVLEKDARSVDVSPLGLNRFREGTQFRSRYRLNVLA